MAGSKNSVVGASWASGCHWCSCKPHQDVVDVPSGLLQLPLKGLHEQVGELLVAQHLPALCRVSPRE